MAGKRQSSILFPSPSRLRFHLCPFVCWLVGLTWDRHDFIDPSLGKFTSLAGLHKKYRMDLYLDGLYNWVQKRIVGSQWRYAFYQCHSSSIWYISTFCLITRGSVVLHNRSSLTSRPLKWGEVVALHYFYDHLCSTLYHKRQFICLREVNVQQGVHDQELINGVEARSVLCLNHGLLQ